MLRIHSIPPLITRRISRTTLILRMNERASLGQSLGVKPSLWDLVWTFNQIALALFGGGLSAWSREVIVVEKQWMGEEEFLSTSTMCRILPGANQVNLAVFIGAKFRGIPGAFAAAFGLTAIPVLIVLALAIVYFRFHQVPSLQKVLHGARSEEHTSELQSQS